MHLLHKVSLSMTVFANLKESFSDDFTLRILFFVVRVINFCGGATVKWPEKHHCAIIAACLFIAGMACNRTCHSEETAGRARYPGSALWSFLRHAWCCTGCFPEMETLGAWACTRGGYHEVTNSPFMHAAMLLRMDHSQQPAVGTSAACRPLLAHQRVC